ncbi:MAG: hypothetical protein DSY37_01485 [Hyperthermus sp.]|nr:MAG: hypothetical protein DSY37_01485 [Hyperthermus sp.]
MQASQGSSSVSKLSRFLYSVVSSLRSEELDNVVRLVELGVYRDLAVVYAASIVNVVFSWIRWEEECRVRRLSSFCSEVEEEVRSHDKSLGIVTYFNTRLKELMVKMYLDISPPLLIPQWIITYSLRIGERLVDKLTDLPPTEQLARLPHLTSTINSINLLLKKYIRTRERGLDEFAKTTYQYIAYELLEPCMSIVNAYHKLASIKPAIIEEFLPAERKVDWERPGRIVSVLLRSLYDAYAKPLLKMISAIRQHNISSQELYQGVQP